MLAGDGLSAKDYVQDGLVAMWDGEWNAGGGVHDPNATTWKDLSGNGYDLTPNGNIVWQSNSATFNGNSYFRRNAISGVVAAECVFRMNRIQFSMLYQNGNAGVIAPNQGGVVIAGSGVGDRNYFSQIWDSQRHSVSANYQDWLFWNGGTEQSPMGQAHNGANGNYLQLGARIYNASFAGYLNGDIYCVRIYSRALTAAEVAANYAVDKARFNLT